MDGLAAEDAYRLGLLAAKFISAFLTYSSYFVGVIQSKS